MQRIEFRAMGCQMLAVVDADDPYTAGALADVPTRFAVWEAHLSRFRDDSELNRLNHSAGAAFHVSDVLWAVMQQALRAARESDGVITPTLLDALEAAGYDRSFESLNGKTTVSLRATRVGDWRAIECGADTRTIRLPRGMRLDFGGVAKGWAADQTAQWLAAYAPALVDAGGDVAISGAMANGEPWPIAVADPLNPECDLALLMLDHGAVATSGRDYRRWQRDGKWQHHIIDPRTGEPAETEVLSATVVAPSASEAEVAAKVALILGSRAGLEWLEAREPFAGLLVLEDGTVVYTARLGNFLCREPVALQVGVER